MYWQRQTLYKSNAITIGQPLKLDLPKHGLLGALVLQFNGTIVSGYGLGGGAWRLIDKISKITVQHGSTPIKSYTGLQAQGISALDQGLIPPGTHRNYGAANVFEYVLINFGRQIHDPSVGLDLAAWNNVQLVIENNAIAASDIASMTVTVQAILLADAPARPFVGYLETQEWRRWTTVQAETKYNLLPEDDIIRRILLQAIPAVDGSFISATGLHNLMYKTKLTFKTGSEVVFDENLEMLLRENIWDNYGYFIAAGKPYVSATKAVPTALGYREGEAHGAGAPHGSAAPAVIPTLADDNNNSQEVINFDADNMISYIELGLAPYGMAQFRFDYDPDPASWLDPAKKSSVELNIQTRDASSAAGGVNAILLDLFKRY
jgi:hypothetical protein